MMQFLWCLIYMGLLGVLSHIIGEALPRQWFLYDAVPFKPYAWEHGGKVYEKLGIRRWKDHVPDMSRIMQDMTPKRIAWGNGTEHIQRLIAETCVAELIHQILCVFAFGIYCIMPTGGGLFLTIVYILLFNVPFILIQRYIRPQLVHLAARLEARQARVSNACTDTVT